MNFYLYYNDKTGHFRIDEVGKTLQTSPNENDYKTVGGSKSIYPLLSFVENYNFHKQIFMEQDGFWNGNGFRFVKLLWDKRHDNLEIRAFKNGDF